MAKVVPFKTKEKDSLDDLLKEAVALKSSIKGLDEEEMLPSSKDYYKTVLMNEIIKRRMIDREMFLCALYVSSIMEKFSRECPEKWFVIDYLMEGLERDKKESIKNGADYCFLICTFFPGRTDYKMMKKKDYVVFGKSMYREYYQQSNKEVAFYMSESFDEISEISALSFSL